MSKFNDQLDEPQIVAAIARAERSTSGEIRVHIERRCPEELMDRAVEIFANLHMHQTKHRNGVLIYVASQDQKLAIIGDAGINALVEGDFWEKEKQLMEEHFKKDRYTEGITKAIDLIGERLQQFFPFHPNDINELPDDVSHGD